MKIDLLINLTRQELEERYAGSALGFVWNVIHPLSMFFIFLLVFGQLMSVHIEEEKGSAYYSVYLLSGMLPWIAFSNTLVRLSGLFVEKKNIISKVPISLIKLPVFVILAESIVFLINMSLFLLIVLVFFGIFPKLIVLALPFVFFVQQIFAASIGIFLGALNVFVRDIREFCIVMSQIWFWMTPIVWTPSAVDSDFYQILQINPMVTIINLYHAMFFESYSYNFKALVVVSLAALLFLTLAYMFLKRLDSEIRDFL